MDINLWWIFFLGPVVICGSPGPNMLQVMACGARYGLRRAVYGMAGCFIPVFIFICISLAGVGALLETFPALFDALRYAGAAYLVYLGIQCWRAPAEESAEEVFCDLPPKTIFRRSLWVGLSNPKALLFATAYFPQFVDAHAPQASQFIIMLATFSIVEISWYIIYATGGRSLALAMRKASVQKAFNKLTGGVFMFFGIMLAAKAH